MIKLLELNFGNHFFQERQVNFDCFPQYINIYITIIMNEFVSHTIHR